MDSYVNLDSEGFSPEEFADIKKCLETLLSIQAGTQPLDRKLGIDYAGIIGYPLNVAKNMLALEIIDKVHIYEPRVEVDSVEFDVGNDGQLIPRPYLIKKEE